MKFFICKKCGFVAETHSDEFEAERLGEDAELFCSKCKGKEFLKMEITINDTHKRMEKKLDIT